MEKLKPMTKQKYTTESDDREHKSLYSAAINGTRTLDVVDRSTGEIVESIIESGRPESTKKERKYTPPEQLFTKVYARVTEAIQKREIEGYEIIVLMNLISRISYQDLWVVNENGVKMTLRAIADSAGLDKNRMNKALDSLADKGFLFITSINRKSSGIIIAKWIAYKG